MMLPVFLVKIEELDVSDIFLLLIVLLQGLIVDFLTAFLNFYLVVGHFEMPFLVFDQ